MTVAEKLKVIDEVAKRNEERLKRWKESKNGRKVKKEV